MTVTGTIEMTAAEFREFFGENTYGDWKEAGLLIGRKLFVDNFKDCFLLEIDWPCLSTVGVDGWMENIPGNFVSVKFTLSR